MTAKEIKEQIQTIKKVSRKVTTSKKASQDFLVHAGIHTKKGKLAKAYRE